ncbi:cathepsin G-like, partial [Alligator sinensis]|uniref:Cathepsin G-like n=1 Tax=Alligator sinensis TaxID=38654 RepID=A0A3Q0FRE4_ALLSI
MTTHHPSQAIPFPILRLTSLVLPHPPFGYCFPEIGKMLLLLLLPVALLLPSTLGDDKITGGREAANDSHPYVASMNIEIFGQVRKRCAGFLIREDVV